MPRVPPQEQADPAYPPGRGSRVLIAFGTPLGRDTLAIALRQEGFAVSSSAADAAGISHAYVADPFDVVIVAPGVPSDFGPVPVSLVANVVAVLPDVAIVAIQAAPSAMAVEALLDAGAAAVVAVEDGFEQLVAALSGAMRGERLVGESLLGLLGAGAELPNLTARELDVLAMVAIDLTNREIADRLHCSLRTVEAERSRLARRLGIQHRREWRTMAATYGLPS